MCTVGRRGCGCVTVFGSGCTVLTEEKGVAVGVYSRKGCVYMQYMY